MLSSICVGVIGNASVTPGGTVTPLVNVKGFLTTRRVPTEAKNSPREAFTNAYRMKMERFLDGGIEFPHFAG